MPPDAHHLFHHRPAFGRLADGNKLFNLRRKLAKLQAELERVAAIGTPVADSTADAFRFEIASVQERLANPQNEPNTPAPEPEPDAVELWNPKRPIRPVQPFNLDRSRK